MYFYKVKDLGLQTGVRKKKKTAYSKPEISLFQHFYQKDTINFFLSDTKIGSCCKFWTKDTVQAQRNGIIPQQICTSLRKQFHSTSAAKILKGLLDGELQCGCCEVDSLGCIWKSRVFSEDISFALLTSPIPS